MNEIIERVNVLRDEVLDTVERGDRDPPGTEVFDAVLRALADGVTGEHPTTGRDAGLHDAISRRLAWGDREGAVLGDAQVVFDRLMIALERAFRDPADQLLVIEAATAVAGRVARIASLAAVARASRERASRLREEMAQRQLRDVLGKQQAAIARLEVELGA